VFGTKVAGFSVRWTWTWWINVGADTIRGWSRGPVVPEWAKYGWNYDGFGNGGGSGGKGQLYVFRRIWTQWHNPVFLGGSTFIHMEMRMWPNEGGVVGCWSG
jgi:hypothetical protein